MSAPVVCVPGQKICKLEENQKLGNGTYERDGFVCASLAGYVLVKKSSDNQVSVEVQRDLKTNVVPLVNSVVKCKITNVNPRFCKCAIIGMDNMLFDGPFRGLIRKEDVRATDRDRVDMYKSFRPGDIVLSRVISFGDKESYLLSTAENELGVVVATSEAGSTMVPISWCEMQCPKTLAKESRKVAKVQPQYLEISET